MPERMYKHNVGISDTALQTSMQKAPGSCYKNHSDSVALANRLGFCIADKCSEDEAGVWPTLLAGSLQGDWQISAGFSKPMHSHAKRSSTH